MITFRLCRAFGWTPRQVRRQSARDIERLLLILNEWHALRGGYGPTSTGLPSTALGTGSAGVGPGATTILVTED